MLVDLLGLMSSRRSLWHLGQSSQGFFHCHPSTPELLAVWSIVFQLMPSNRKLDSPLECIENLWWDWKLAWRFKIFWAFVLQLFLLRIKCDGHAPTHKVVNSFTAVMCIYRSSRTEQVIKYSVWFSKYYINFKIIKSMDIMSQCFSF